MAKSTSNIDNKHMLLLSNDKSVMKERILWIDLAKAIGIYLVVLGHSLQQEVPIEGNLRDFIYIFHMPLFFFLSGYLFNVREENFLAFLKKSIYSLLVPYVFLNVVAFFLWLPIYLHGHYDLKLQIVRFLIGESHSPAGPAWFLLCLFWVRLLAYFIKRSSLYVQVILILSCCILAYYFPFRIYWCIDSAFIAFPFFMIGNYMKCIGLMSNKTSINILLSLILFIVTIILSCIQGNTDVNYRIMGAYPLLYFPSALMGVLMIVCGCSFIRKSNALIKTFASGSIIIMGLHGAFGSYIGFLLSMFFPMSITDHWFYPVLLCMVVMIVMYYPIIFLQNKCSKFIGGR